MFWSTVSLARGVCPWAWAARRVAVRGREAPWRPASGLAGSVVQRLRGLPLCVCFFPLLRGPLTSLSVVMGFSASSFTSLRFCSVHFKILLLGAYTLGPLCIPDELTVL